MTVSSGTLRALAAAATPGRWWPYKDGEIVGVCTDDGQNEVVPWNEGVSQMDEADARLIALAPDLAVLLADTMDALEHMSEPCGEDDCTYCQRDLAPLLARFRELEERADGRQA